MITNSRRDFILNGVTLAGVVAASPLASPAARADDRPQDANTDYAILTTAQAPHQPVRILDTDRMPWPPPATSLGWNMKTLYLDESTGDHLVIIRVPIGGPGGQNHYHTFHEWAYWLSGDFVNNEYTSPYQRIGPFQQFREGTFLDRPAYSLHGGEVDRLDSQVGGTCLIMEEGGKTIGVIPGQRGYSEEFRDVKQWAVPRIIDTISELPWEKHDSFDAVLIKRLVDDQVRGFRAILWRLPQKWEATRSTEFSRGRYYRQAHQFNFVLNGDLRIQAYQQPDRRAEAVTLGKSFYFERPPMSIFGLAEGIVSEAGCVWLEVTYAKGTSIPNMPIEEPTLV